MMNTLFDMIVSKDHIGKSDNPFLLNSLIKTAVLEKMKPSSEDNIRSILLAVDVQKDFMEGGALGVPGSVEDVLNLTKWIYENLERITSVSVSMDTHLPFQIFHPCWWVDANGENPPPFTPITEADLAERKWRPVFHAEWSMEYVVNLQKQKKKTLVVWPYHCLLGSSGHSLENQFANMMYFHSAVRKTQPDILIKGNDPMTEMYGIYRPEYSKIDMTNKKKLSALKEYDRVIISGEAKSHCVLETIRQILDFYSGDREMAGRIYILEDCMSCIPGFEKQTEDAYEEFSGHYGVNMVKSSDFKL